MQEALEEAAVVDEDGAEDEEMINAKAEMIKEIGNDPSVVMTTTTTAGLTASTLCQTTLVETVQPQPRATARKQPSPTAWTAAAATCSITSWAKAEGVGRKLKLKIKLVLRIKSLVTPF